MSPFIDPNAFNPLSPGNLPGTLPGLDRLSDLGPFGSNPGQLRARTYIPDRLPAGAPLVVVLHGCTQTAADYDRGSGWSTLADRFGFALLFPEQSRANNPNLCFNWFVPGDCARDDGEPLSIRQMIETVAAAQASDRRRVFITGLSAGGAMTSVMLATYPELFAGGAIIAGLPYGCATTMPEAFERMRGAGALSDAALQALVRGASGHAGPWPRISIWHGSADMTVHPANAEAILTQWRAVHGLGEAPARTDIVDGHPRRVWCDGEGREVVEMYSITGHGARHAAGDGRQRGLRRERRPHAGGEHLVHAAHRAILGADAGGGCAARRRGAAERRAAGAREEPGESPWSGGVAAGIHKTITDALRAAGLMQ